MAAMAFVTQPWHVFALRAVQGLFAGYGALTLAMAAESAPRERMAQAIGTVQTAQRLGPALGPVHRRRRSPAGRAAHALSRDRGVLRRGARAAARAVPRAAACITPSDRQIGGACHASRNVLAFENFLLLMAVDLRPAVRRSQLRAGAAALRRRAGRACGSRRVRVGRAVLGAACAAAVGHHFCGRLLRRWSARDVISRAALVSAGAVALFVVIAQCVGARRGGAVFGGGVGVAMTAAYTQRPAWCPPTSAARASGCSRARR